MAVRFRGAFSQDVPLSWWDNDLTMVIQERYPGARRESCQFSQRQGSDQGRMSWPTVPHPCLALEFT